MAQLSHILLTLLTCHLVLTVTQANPIHTEALSDSTGHIIDTLMNTGEGNGLVGRIQQHSLRHTVQRVLEISRGVSGMVQEVQAMYISEGKIDKSLAFHIDKDVIHTHFDNLPDVPDINVLNTAEIQVLYRIHQDMEMITEYLKLVKTENQQKGFTDISNSIDTILKGHTNDEPTAFNTEINSERESETNNDDFHTMGKLRKAVRHWIEKISAESLFQPLAIVTAANVPEAVKEMTELVALRDYSVFHHTHKYMQYVHTFSCVYLRTRFDQDLDC